MSDKFDTELARNIFSIEIESVARMQVAGFQCCDEIERLEQANAELRRDAERFRWLKANHLQTGPDSWIRTGDDLEEAIDAGMKSSATKRDGK